MNQVEKEFVLARMEELDHQIRNHTEYRQQAKIANESGKRFRDACNKGEGVWKAYCEYEEELSKSNCIYSEAAYRLGFGDGILIGMEKEPDGRKSVLTIEDMSALVKVYDSVQKLRETMLGGANEYWEEGGVLAVFESVYDIIEHATCAEIRLKGEDECSEVVTGILDTEMPAEERAKQLLEIKR